MEYRLCWLMNGKIKSRRLQGGAMCSFPSDVDREFALESPSRKFVGYIEN